MSLLNARASARLRRGEQDFPLQITSLIDSLVIILIFMLMTVGSGSINLEMATNIKLPWVSSGADLTQGVKLVTRVDGIYLEEEKVAPLHNGAVMPETTAEAGKKILPLFQKLASIAVESTKAAEKSGVKFEGKVLIQADKTIPLKTIQKQLYTAARAGFHDFKFAVLRQ